MTGEQMFETLGQDAELRQLIVDLAKSFTREPKQQEALVHYAWMTVAEAGDGKTREYYMRLVYRVMRHKYTIYYMRRPSRYVSDDAGIQRANRKVKKFSAV
jgi:hypothetical protein